MFFCAFIFGTSTGHRLKKHTAHVETLALVATTFIGSSDASFTGTLKPETKEANQTPSDGALPFLEDDSKFEGWRVALSVPNFHSFRIIRWEI